MKMMRIAAALLALAVVSAAGWSAAAQTVAHERLMGPVLPPTGCDWTAAEKDWLTPERGELLCHHANLRRDHDLLEARAGSGSRHGED